MAGAGDRTRFFRFQDVTSEVGDFPLVARWVPAALTAEEAGVLCCEEADAAATRKRQETGPDGSVPESADELVALLAVRQLSDQIEAFDEIGKCLRKEFSLHDQSQVFELERDVSTLPISQGIPRKHSLRELLETVEPWQRRVLIMSRVHLPYGSDLPAGTELIVSPESIPSESPPAALEPSKAVTLPCWRLPDRWEVSEDGAVSPRNTAEESEGSPNMTLVHVPVDERISCMLSPAGGSVHFLKELGHVLSSQSVKATAYPVPCDTSSETGNTVIEAQAEKVTLRSKTYVLATSQPHGVHLIWWSPTLDENDRQLQLISQPPASVYRTACSQLSRLFDLRGLKILTNKASDSRGEFTPAKESSFEGVGNGGIAGDYERPVSVPRRRHRCVSEQAPEALYSKPRPVPRPRKKPMSKSEGSESCASQPPTPISIRHRTIGRSVSTDEDCDDDDESTTWPASRWKKTDSGRSRSFHGRGSTGGRVRKSSSLHSSVKGVARKTPTQQLTASIPHIADNVPSHSRPRSGQIKSPSSEFLALRKALGVKLEGRSSSFKKESRPDFSQSGTLPEPTYFVLEGPKVEPASKQPDSLVPSATQSRPASSSYLEERHQDLSGGLLASKFRPKPRKPKRQAPPSPAEIRKVVKRKAPPPPKPNRSDLGYVDMLSDCDDHQKLARGVKLFYLSTDVMPSFPATRRTPSGDLSKGSKSDGDCDYSYDYVDIPGLTAGVDGYEDVLVPGSPAAASKGKATAAKAKGSGDDGSDYEQIDEPQPQNFYIQPIA